MKRRRPREQRHRRRDVGACFDRAPASSPAPIQRRRRARSMPCSSGDPTDVDEVVEARRAGAPASARGSARPRAPSRRRRARRGAARVGDRLRCVVLERCRLQAVVSQATHASFAAQPPSTGMIGAGHVRSAVGREERGDLGDLFRLAAAVQRGLLEHARDVLAARAHRGVDEARAEAVGADALARRTRRRRPW